MMIRLVVVVLLAPVLLLQVGCASMKSMVGKSTFDPQSYGTIALVGVIKDSSSTRMDALVSARELKNRSIASIPEADFIQIITNDALQPEARVEVIDLLSSKGLAQYKESYRTAALGDPDSAVAERAGMAYYEWAGEGEEKETFLLTALKDSPHPVMRTRAAIALRGLGPKFLEPLLEQVKKEESASAVYAICEALGDYQTPEALAALEAIANDIEKEYDTDNHLGDGKEIDSNAVRAFCVKALESSSSAVY